MQNSESFIRKIFSPDRQAIIIYKRTTEKLSMRQLIQEVFLKMCYLETQQQVSKLENKNMCNHQYSIDFKVTGIDIYGDTYKYETGAIDFKTIMLLYLKSITSKVKADKEEAVRKLWKLLGIDTQQYSCNLLPNNLCNLSIPSYQLIRFSGLQITSEPKTALSQQQPQTHLTPLAQPFLLTQQTLPLSLNADKCIYAISRARLQYLGQNIPLFKYGHALFEALISALHPESVTPEGVDNITDLTPFDLAKQEKFLCLKYLEFQNSPLLSDLLKLSHSGQTEQFIHAFNSLQEGDYSKFKVSLYDINQRMFIIDQTHATKNNAFIVHYNGFVFGTNHAKMFTIREREIGLHERGSDDGDSSSECSEFEEGSYQSIGYKIRRQKKIERQQKKEKEEEDVDVLMSDSEMGSNPESEEEGSEDEEQVMRVRDDVVSEVDMRTQFVMSSNALKSSSRRKKILAKLPKNQGNVTSGSGLIVFKIEFSKQKLSDSTEIKEVKRLICYGYFPWLAQSTLATQTLTQSQPSHIYKQFIGQSAHISFVLWLLEAVINYKKDFRSHSRFINVFTFNGSAKELPLILRALVSIVGRDTYFIGDLQKIKSVWYENIKFYDLNNFFEGRNLPDLVNSWLTNRQQKDKLSSKAGQDFLLRKVLLTFEVVYKFLDELQSITFNQGRCFYDFALYSQSSASSLALSIFQYLYLDKQHIKGTNEVDIFEKEKLSLKSPYYIINNVTQDSLDEESKSPIYRLYEIKHSMAACFKEFPIPFEYIKRKQYHKDFQFEDGKYQFKYQYQQVLDVWNIETGQSLKLQYTSLYKVDKLEKSTQSLILPVQTAFGLDYTLNKQSDTSYIWGVELIHAIMEKSQSVIYHLVISEEISYLQGKVFSPFVNELWEKLLFISRDNPCQRDILEMILKSFPSKFSQKYFGNQQIIHINDLLIMKQTTFAQTDQTSNPIAKLHEFEHPYYYIHYYPQGSDQLQQICSLLRISSYINACHRVKLYQQLQQFDGALQNIFYLDNQYLLLKNRELIDHKYVQMKLPGAAKLSSHEQMGKYRKIQDCSEMSEEMLKYIQYFQKKGEKDDNQKQGEVEQLIVKNFNIYKLLAKQNHKEDVKDDQYLENFVKLLLSSDKSAYISAPIIQTKLQTGHSQQAKNNQFLCQFGISLEQAQELKQLFNNSLEKLDLINVLQAIPNISSNNEEIKERDVIPNKAILQNPSFINQLKEATQKFEAYLHEKEDPTQYQQQELSQTSLFEECQLISKTKQNDKDSESSSAQMSQEELQKALECGEDSSSQDSLQMKLARSGGGNLVFDFFSQQATR